MQSDLRNLLPKHYYGENSELIIAFKTGWDEAFKLATEVASKELESMKGITLRLAEETVNKEKGPTPWNKGLTQKQMKQYKKLASKKRQKKSSKRSLKKRYKKKTAKTSRA